MLNQAQRVKSIPVKVVIVTYPAHLTRIQKALSLKEKAVIVCAALVNQSPTKETLQQLTRNGRKFLPIWFLSIPGSQCVLLRKRYSAFTVSMR